MKKSSRLTTLSWSANPLNGFHSVNVSIGFLKKNYMFFGRYFYFSQLIHLITFNRTVDCCRCFFKDAPVKIRLMAWSFDCPVKVLLYLQIYKHFQFSENQKILKMSNSTENQKNVNFSKKCRDRVNFFFQKLKITLKFQGK